MSSHTPSLPGPSGETLRRYVGAARQAARAERYVLEDGPGQGARVVRLSTAGGFDVEVLPDRCLDLGMVAWRSIPLAWSSPLGIVAPSRVPGTHDAFLRGFGGGLLTTCGLDQFGTESTTADGDLLPMHGRAHLLAASDLHTWADPLGIEPSVGVSGTMRQATALGEHLRLDRRIVVDIAADQLTIWDRVTNDAPDPWPHLVLYHMNLGWPVLTEATTFAVHRWDAAGRALPPVDPEPRDAAATAGQATWDRMPPPQTAYPEQVFRHALADCARVTATATSPLAGIRVSVQVNGAQFPVLYQWKQASEGRYAVGIEPANAPAIHGQAVARAEGVVPMLAPGECREYRIDIRVEPLEPGNPWR